MPCTDPLSPLQIHLWYSRVPAEIDAALAARYRALLTPEEAAQLARFYFERDQRRYLLTRALVRTVLSRYAPVEPGEWRFEPTTHGRPVITNPHPLARRLSFNISHTSTAVVLAVTTGRDIGVDIECTDRDAPLEVADRFFSPSEAAALRQLPKPAQPHRFWELWTFKESYIKARGLGLSLPLDKFSFHFEREGEVRLSIDETLNDSPARWALWQLRLDTDHLLALCAQCLPAGPPEIVCTQLTPLGDMAAWPASVTRLSPAGLQPTPDA